MGMLSAPQQARRNASRSDMMWLLFLIFGLPIGLLFLAGQWVVHHVDVRMRPEKAACKSGDATACATVGEAYAEKGGRYGDDGVAEDYFERGCKLGVARSCYRLGWIATNTSDAHFSWKRALPAFEQACQGNVPEACNEAGKAYFGGVSYGDTIIEENDAKAAPLLERGCSGGVMESCANLAATLRDGKGVSHDPARARELVARACAGGYARACQTK